MSTSAIRPRTTASNPCHPLSINARNAGGMIPMGGSDADAGEPTVVEEALQVALVLDLGQLLLVGPVGPEEPREGADLDRLEVVADVLARPEPEGLDGLGLAHAASRCSARTAMRWRCSVGVP